MIHLALITAAVAAASPQPDSSVLAGFLAQGAAVDARADVLTSADLRNALDLEAQKQVASCGDGASCLAEIAQALDAHVVLSSTLSTIEDEWVLQVSAYDARKASSAGRRLIRATTQKALMQEAETAGRDLMLPVLAAHEGGARLRVLVLDVAVTPGAAAVAPPPEPSPFGALSVGGGAAAGIGAITTVVAIASDVVATTPPTTVKEAAASSTARSVAGIAYPVGVGLILVGATMVLVDGVME
jgi:hypothetical protein